jgi:hypothetical protein
MKAAGRGRPALFLGALLGLECLTYKRQFVDFSSVTIVCVFRNVGKRSPSQFHCSQLNTSDPFARDLSGVSASF